MPVYAKPRFPHELEWYEYWYEPSCQKVAVVSKAGQCKIYFYSKEALQELCEERKLNIFLYPIFQEALRHFPTEEPHV